MKSRTFKILHSKFYDGNKLNLAMAILGTTILSFAILLTPYLMQQVIDFVSGNFEKDWRELILIGILIILMELFAGVCTYYFRTSFSTKAVFQYRSYVLEKILNKDIQNFNKESLSTYLSSMVNDIFSIKEKYLDMIPIIFQILICFFGSIIIMGNYSFKLTVIAIIISFIPFVSSIISRKNLSKAEILLSKNNSYYMGILKDVFSGFSTIKTFQSEISFDKIHRRKCENVRASQQYREKIIEMVNYTAAISGYVTQFLILLACILFSFYDDSITAGTIIVFSRLINYLIDPVTNLPAMFANVKASLSLIEKFSEILECNFENQNFKKLPKLNSSIKFKNVSFSYLDNQRELILKNINLEFIKGKCYIIVGSSGSGKSTILKLIMKMIKPCEGSIFYDEINLVEVSEDEIYNSISYIQQEATIFNDSILNNISMYKNFSKKEIQKAIEQSALEEFINEKGLHYECGEGGKFLSGGERQRIAIARSLIKNKNIILGDEITSSLDKNNSFHVLSSIVNLENVTRILVLHDLDEKILRRADEIIVLKSGEIEERGSFEKLIDRKKYFYSLFTISKSTF